MFKYGLFLCCLVSLILICACGKREMTDKDIAEAMKIVRKYDQALYLGDTQTMLNCSNLLLSFSQKFTANGNSDNLRHLALLRQGDAYAFLKKYEKSIQAYAKVLEEKPCFQTQLVALRNQILVFSMWEHYQDADNTAEKALKLLESLRKKGWFKNAEIRKDYMRHYEIIVRLLGKSLYMQHRYDDAEKLYLQFLSCFKSEKEMAEIIYDPSSVYYYFSKVFHGKKDSEKELSYLRKSLLCRKDGTEVQTELYIRLAAYAVRDKKWKDALDYCNAGMKVKPCFLDRKSKLLHYQMLEAAKEKICGLIKIEKTEKVSSPDHAVISPDLEDHLNWLLFDF